MHPVRRSSAYRRPATVDRKMVSEVTSGWERISDTLGTPNAHFSLKLATFVALTVVFRCQRVLAAS